MSKFKHWIRDTVQTKTINYKMKQEKYEKNEISVHITESWNSEDTGHVMIDFVIYTDCGRLEETIYIPSEAFKELIKIQKKAKVTNKP